MFSDCHLFSHDNDINRLRIEKIRRQAIPLRHIQMPNPSKDPYRGLFSFGFKGCWQIHLPLGDWALVAERVSERPAFLFGRPSTTMGLRKKSLKFHWAAGFTPFHITRNELAVAEERRSPPNSCHRSCSEVSAIPVMSDPPSLQSTQDWATF